MKKAIKVICIVLAAVIVIAACYLAYVFLAYHRLGNMELSVGGGSAAAQLRSGTEYGIVSYNIGFGAYESDYGFFMDGGSLSKNPFFDKLSKFFEQF